MSARTSATSSAPETRRTSRAMSKIEDANTFADARRRMRKRRDNLRRRATDFKYEVDDPPLIIPIARVIEEVASEITIPKSDYPKQFNSFLLSRETADFAEMLFWYVHCTLFQEDSEGQTEHLAMKMAVLTTHLMNSRKTKQPCYMRYYPYAVGYAISACYKKMFPGSTAVRTAKFTEDVLRIASGLWNGMEMNRASHRHICQLAGIDAFKGERPSSAHSMQSADGDIEPIVEFPKKARLRHSVSRLLPVLQVEGPSDAAGAFFMTVGPQSAPLSPRTRPLSRGSQLSLKSDTQEVDDGGWAGLLGDPDTVALKNARIRMIRAEKVKRERTHNVQKFDAFALSPLMSRCLHRVPLTGHPKQVLHRTMRPDGAPGLYGTQYGYLGLDNKDPKLYARLYQRIGNPVDHAYYERLSSMTKKAVKACHDQLHYETEKLNHLEDVVMAQSRRMMKGRVAGYDEMMKPRELEANEEGKKMTRHVIPTVAGQVRGLLDPTIKAMLSEPMRRPSYWNAMRTVSPLNEISATIGTLRKRNLQSVWDHV